MKKHLLAVVFSFIGIICYAQNGLEVESRTVGNFNRISSCCGIEVCIDEGESPTIRIETNDNSVLSKIKTQVKNGELKISVNVLNWNKPKNLTLKVYVSANSLSGIHASSGSHIYTTGKLTADNVDISAGSGSNINLNIKAKTMECSSTAGSYIKLKGTADAIKAEATSGAIIDGKELTAERAEAQASSGASVKLDVSKELSGKASSGGRVVYSGNAKVTHKRQSSGGVVMKG